MYERIVVTLDGSAYSECALDSAEALARSLGAKVVLLQVVPYPKVYDASFESDYEAGAEEYLGGIAQRLRGTGLEVKIEIPWGDVVSTIVSHVEADDKTLLIMASHGRTGLTKLAFGSVAADVLRKARSTATARSTTPSVRR